MQTNIVRTNIRIISFHKGVERLKEEAGVYPCCGSRRSEILMKWVARANTLIQDVIFFSYRILNVGHTHQTTMVVGDVVARRCQIVRW